MAEAIVGPVIERLGSLLIEEVKLLTGVHKGIADIKAELESIQSFLRDADKRVDRDDADNWMKEWVKQVREVAFQIEDVIDEYILNVAPRPGQRRCSLHKIIRLVKKLKARHQIASEIGELKNSVHEINRRGRDYGLLRTEHSAAGQSTWHDPRVSYPFVDKAELVGIEAPIDKLMNSLVEGPSKNVVISLVGMGGIGKSTLAKKAIEHPRLMGHFHCSAWITVSQSYNFVQLLKSMVQKFRSSANEPPLRGIGSMDEQSLIQKLRDYLSEKRYTVVFDDVWDSNVWEYMDHALPNNDKGNRIIITTRNENVAPSPKTSSFYYITNVQPLSEEKAMELFSKKVFQYEGGQCECPKELDELSRAIVGRCGGMPLAIVTLGGLLATKERNILEWQNFYGSLSYEIASNKRLSAITKILTLSYHDLPFHLKSCYLYFGMFPEDKSIDCRKLIRLWMAEGFIRIRQGKTLEDVGEEYLAELIQRSLVQVARFEADGKVMECRVHDLLYEIICSRSKELGLHHVIADNGTNFEGIGRRLSIVNHGANNDILESGCNFKTRSIVFCANELPESLRRAMFTSLRLISVLDFEGAPLDYIPEEVGSLLHLIYLNLRKTKVKMLPRSINKLQNLQTLDLRECPLCNPSINVDGLLKMRCLLVVTYHFGPNYSVNSVKGLKICGRIKSLDAIQRLRDIEVGEDEELLRDLGGLSQLRSLGILKLKREHGQLLCAALEKMNYLSSLEVFSSNEGEVLDLQSINHPPPYLRQLYLAGRLAKMPDWISKLENLVILWLNWSKLEDDPLQVLHMLPNIQRMILRECYNGEQLHFKNEGFRKLKVLVLAQWNRLKMVTIEEGALHSLEKLHLFQLPHLKEVPTGIHHLSNLKSLFFVDIERELVRSILPGGGHDYSKVKHVPDVNFGYYNREGGYVYHKLGDANLLEYLKNGETSSTPPP